MSEMKWILVEVGTGIKTFHVITPGDTYKCESDNIGAKIEFSQNGLTISGHVFCSSTDREFVMKAKSSMDRILDKTHKRIYCLLQYSKSPSHLVHRLVKMRVDSLEQKAVNITDEDGFQYKAAILWTTEDGERGANQLYEMRKQMIGPKSVYCNWDERVWLLVQYFTAKSIINYAVINISEYSEYIQRYRISRIVMKSPSRRKLLVELKNCKNSAYSLEFPLSSDY